MKTLKEGDAFRASRQVDGRVLHQSLLVDLSKQWSRVQGISIDPLGFISHHLTLLLKSLRFLAPAISRSYGSIRRRRFRVGRS